MRNKDVLKKLKNLPDNTKEYIDTNELVKVITDFEIASNGKVAMVYTDSLTTGRRYRFPFESYPNIASAAIIKKYEDDTTKNITIMKKSTDYVYVSAMYKTFDIYHRSAFGTMIRVNGTFGTTSSEYTSTSTKVVLDTVSDDKLFEPTKDYHPATKKYVDDNMANVPLKKITSTEQTPIIISELSDGIYDFGNTSFVKMFSSDTEILKNVLGICILYSISDVKKILFANYKSKIAIFNVEDRYALDIQNKTYTMLQFTKLVSIGGSTITPLVLIDEITENGGDSFGLYQTTCTNLKLTANSKAVSLDSGSKILLVTSSTTKEIKTYRINSFGAFSIKKIKYEYNKNTKEATLKSVDTVVFKSDFDNTIYDVKKNDTYIRAIYGNPFNVLNESIKNATYVNNDKTNDKNVTRYFNINKAIDNITDFDKCIIHLKFYRYGELKIYRTITGFNRPFNYFNTLLSTDDCMVMIKLALDKQINENLEEIDAKNKCYCSIKYALTAEQEAIDIIDTGNIEIQMANNRILQLNNTKEFVPTGDYNPATKKYVDDANVEATDEEVDAMLLEVLGGDYSVQS